MPHEICSVKGSASDSFIRISIGDNVLRFLRASTLGLAIAATCSTHAATVPTARPAFWTVHGSSGTAFVLGSVHALPPNVLWRRPEFDEAAKESGTFVFEVSNDPDDIAEATRFIRKRGLLPTGTALHDLLTPVAQKDYAAACALAGMNATALDDKRPWLAAIVLTVSYLNQRNVTYLNTPDETYLEEAKQDKKNLLTLDTTRGQLEFLARFDETMGVNGFSAMLGDFTGQPQRVDKLIETWALGDVNAMAALIGSSFENDPQGARLFAAHNQVWARELEDLLRHDRKYFVVVGIAHLVGPTGVPALLRADGLKVDGP